MVGADAAAERLAALAELEKEIASCQAERRLAADLLNELKIKDKPVSVFEDPKYKKPVDEDEWWKKPRVKQENVVVTPEDWASLTMRSKKLMI